MGEWNLVVRLGADTFPHLKEIAKETFSAIDRARNHRELPIMGSTNNIMFWSVQCSSPVEQRIADLRREADELEAKAKSGQL